MHIMNKIVEFDAKLKRSDDYEKVINECISFCRCTCESDMWDDVAGFDHSDIEKVASKNNARVRKLFMNEPENGFCFNDILNEDLSPVINIWKAKVDDAKKIKAIDWVDALGDDFIVSYSLASVEAFTPFAAEQDIEHLAQFLKDIIAELVAIQFAKLNHDLKKTIYIYGGIPYETLRLLCRIKDNSLEIMS